MSGPSAGQRIPVREAQLLIGREQDCHLRPQSGFVSRHHCVLLLDEYTLRVRDLGSQNGTFVNGKRIGRSEVILLQGDLIAVGDFDVQVELMDSNAPLNATVTLGEDITQAEKGKKKGIPAIIPPAPNQPPADAADETIQLPENL